MPRTRLRRSDRRLGHRLVDPVADASVLEHLTEIAVIVALFSAGLKLDRQLTWRAGSTAGLLLIAMPVTIALLGSQLLGLSAPPRCCCVHRADRPGARRRHRRRPAR